MEPKTVLWKLDPHTRGKHLVLRKYLDAWFPILGKTNGRILFIDGFAGPGEYEGGEEGSPLIALSALRDHRAKGIITAETLFAFIEADEERAKHLNTLVAAWKPSLPSNCATQVIHGKFDETMAQVVDSLDAQRKRLAPCFVMVDPFGVSDTPMNVISRILQNPKSEVYVSFMYEFINRFKITPEFEPHLDQLFGCTNWRNGCDIADSETRECFFYDLYEAQLRKSGAQYVVRFELFEGDRLVYAIFFATRHSIGCDRMKQAIWKVAPWGDYAFHGTCSSQLTLGIETPDFQPLRTALQKHFQGKGWIKVEEVAEYVASDETDYYTGQLKKGALIPMEEAGEIEVDASTRKKKRTYPDTTRLRFLPIP